jgi:nucleotide-binding universal stress UspA family protein
VICVTFLGAYQYIPAFPFVANLRAKEVEAMETGNHPPTCPAAILVATDLSDLSRLMPFAFSMADESGAQLLLLHVLTVGEKFTPNASGMPCYDREGAFSCASGVLEPWCAQARKLGVPCTALVREGSPVAREIVAAIRRFRPDCLLLGTRSRSRLGKLFLGSVAEQVLCSVNLPVVTVGPEAHLPTGENSRQPTVLFASSPGEGHQDRAALACQLAGRQKAKLILLHVLPAGDEDVRPGGSNNLRSTISYELQQLAHRIGDNACTEVDVRVVHGDPAIEILAQAEANDASLVVMGAADLSLFDELIHDRTICRVLAHARCPVLSLHGSAAHHAPNERGILAIES